MPYIIKNGIAYAGHAVTVTQAQYDALSEAEKKNGTVYYIYDSDAVLDAGDVSYDNTSSGLSAANTQAAIDEISSDVESLNNGLTNVSYIGISTTRITGWCYKVGKICMLTIVNGTAGTTDANTILFTLPQGYRPVAQTEFVDSYGKIRMRITDSGQISNVEQSTTFIRGTCVFIAQ